MSRSSGAGASYVADARNSKTARPTQAKLNGQLQTLTHFLTGSLGGKEAHAWKDIKHGVGKERIRRDHDADGAHLCTPKSVDDEEEAHRALNIPLAELTRILWVRPAS